MLINVRCSFRERPAISWKEIRKSWRKHSDYAEWEFRETHGCKLQLEITIHFRLYASNGFFWPQYCVIKLWHICQQLGLYTVYYNRMTLIGLKYDTAFKYFQLFRGCKKIYVSFVSKQESPQIGGAVGNATPWTSLNDIVSKWEPFSEAKLSNNLKLNQLNDFWIFYFERILRNQDTTIPQYRYINVICRRPEVTDDVISSQDEKAFRPYLPVA